MLSRKWLRVASFVVLSLATLYLGGCINIQITDRTPSSQESTPAAAEEVEEHDLAVLAVDFDPPLEYEEIIEQQNKGEGITLLVAVENIGANAEHNVSVQVELSKDNEATLFLYKEGSIDSIAPGEIKIVHFKDTEIPFSYEYVLRVQVVPVDGEVSLSDNQKSYGLLITQP